MLRRAYRVPAPPPSAPPSGRDWVCGVGSAVVFSLAVAFDVLVQVEIDKHFGRALGAMVAALACAFLTSALFTRWAHPRDSNY